LPFFNNIETEEYGSYLNPTANGFLGDFLIIFISFGVGKKLQCQHFIPEGIFIRAVFSGL